MIKFNHFKNIIKSIYLIFLGLIGFSLLGQYVVLSVLKLPFFFIEWVYLPVIIHFMKKGYGSKNKVNIYYLFLILMLLVSCVVQIVNDSSTSSITDYRSMLYLLIVYSFIKKNDCEKYLDDLVVVCFFSIIGEILFIQFFASREIVSSTNCIGASFAIIYLFVFGKYKMGLVTFGLFMFQGIISGYRLGIIFATFSLFLSFIYIFFSTAAVKGGLNLLKRVSYVGIITIVFGLFITYYETIVMYAADLLNMDRFAVFRITTRMRGIVNMDISMAQDNERMVIWTYPMRNFISSLFPTGFIETPGLYIDVPVLQLYAVFGSLVTVVIVAWFIKGSIEAVYVLFKTKNLGNTYHYKVYTAMVIMSIVMIGLFIINGTFMKTVYQAIETAIFIAMLMRTKKQLYGLQRQTKNKNEV